MKAKHGRHIIKATHSCGEKLRKPESWCEHEPDEFDWLFQDAQHAVLSVGGSIDICPDCIRSIISELEKEL